MGKHGKKLAVSEVIQWVGKISAKLWGGAGACVRLNSLIGSKLI